MAINTGKVVTGGLVAGVVMIVVNVIAQFVLMDRMKMEMERFAPGSSARMSMGAGGIAARIIITFVIGMTLVWLYAAIRPRFGPGPRTAAIAAIVVWILGGIFYSDWPMMGMMSVATYCMFAVVQLISLLLATWLGARLYSEDTTAATAAHP